MSKLKYTNLLIIFLLTSNLLCSNILAQSIADSSSSQNTSVSANEMISTLQPLEGKPINQVIKTKFIEGGVPWMAPLLILLIIGLALAIERIIYLNLATVNTNELLEKIETSLKTEGIEGAKEICRNTRGPVASIFYQGLDRSREGIDIAEKAIISYGAVQTGLLEKGLTWISLFIAMAPMMGFLGTVVGMVQAFDAIEIAGEISPVLVASGIKVALITTIFGLIVAMILQVFYSYLINKIDSIVNNMEDASISLIDLLVRHKYNTNQK